MATGLWIQTDEAEDVAGSVRHALRVSSFLADDPQAWKWVMLALHAALQGACVCHLTTTAAPIGALTKQNTTEWLEYFESLNGGDHREVPKTQLLGLPELLKAVRKPRSAGDASNDNGIAISDVELNWLRRLHSDFRNQFVHFEPIGWSIEVSGIAELGRITSRILLEILETGWAFRHLGAAGRDDLRRDLLRLAAIEWPNPTDED